LFHGIDFWCVGRQEVGVQPSTFSQKERGGLLAAVSIQPVPDQQDWFRKVAQEMPQEFNNQSAIDGNIGVKTKAQGQRTLDFGIDAQSCNR
jgi:hypothetical protein